MRWLESLSAQGTHRISQFVARDARLRTPEVEGAGPQAMAQIYASWFEDAQKVTLRVTDHAAGADGHTHYLRWDRVIVGARGDKQILSGVSEITLGLTGKITSIIEHWDSAPEPLKKRGYWARLFNR